MRKEQYLEKMNTIFHDKSKFMKLQRNPLKSDLDQFRKLLKKIKPFLTKKRFYSLDPKGIKLGLNIEKQTKQKI